jgi:DNA ligase-associated metallophosphoesterase
MYKRLILNGQEILLLPEKAVYIPAEEMLVISDWHLGKLAHFRQEGVLVPFVPVANELDRLGKLISMYKVDCVVFLGDLFHSRLNGEWHEFVQYIGQFPEIRFVLTKGNHDILPAEALADVKLEVLDELVINGGIVLSHEPVSQLTSSMTNLVGHIHPGCVVHVKGRQRFRLPCFLLDNNILTLPAFGKWTGLHIVKNKGNNQVFAVVDDAVLEV